MYRYKCFKLNGKVYQEHRIIMEIYLCRPLRPNEVVHHKNGNGRDNRLCNLELMTRQEHTKLHQQKGDYHTFFSWPIDLMNEIFNEYIGG